QAATSDPAPATAEADGDSAALDAVVVDLLLGRGTLLLGATELLETARTPVAVHAGADAERLGLAVGNPLVIQGPGGTVRLPVAISDAVVPGCLVLPGGVTPDARREVAGTDGGMDQPLRVRIAAAQPVTA